MLGLGIETATQRLRVRFPNHWVIVSPLTMLLILFAFSERILHYGELVFLSMWCLFWEVVLDRCSQMSLCAFLSLLSAAISRFYSNRYHLHSSRFSCPANFFLSALTGLSNICWIYSLFRFPAFSLLQSFLLYSSWHTKPSYSLLSLHTFHIAPIPAPTFPLYKQFWHTTLGM